jgi:hypothetical protein
MWLMADAVSCFLAHKKRFPDRSNTKSRCSRQLFDQDFQNVLEGLLENINAGESDEEYEEEDDVLLTDSVFLRARKLSEMVCYVCLNFNRLVDRLCD